MSVQLTNTMTLYIGDDALYTVILDDGDITDHDDAVDTDYEFVIHPTSGDAVVTKTTGTAGGVTVVHAATGELTIEIDAADTADLPAGNYNWYVRDITDGGVQVRMTGVLCLLAK